jgi:hypothetical protein
LAGGCAYLRQGNEPPDDLLRRPWKEPGSESVTLPETDKIVIDGLAAQFAAATPIPAAGPQRPLNILALSAGGKYAAYAAGVLNGWTAHGTRPEFDIVTGVSSGAIVSLFAYLGPQYDEKLKCFFTQFDQADLFRFRPVRNLILHGSMAYPTGLKRIIEEEIDEATLAEIAAAHHAGRRLYLATLNVHTKMPVFWDVGGIASSGRPDALDLVRKVMLAATAVPGLLPAVEFDIVVDGVHYKELHSDGGPVTQTFVKFGPHRCPLPGTKWLAGSQLYCLAAGKIDPDPVPGRMGVVKRIGASVSACLYALYKVELLKLYALCVTSGMQFNLASIPQDTKLDVVSTRIKASEMRPLYDLGYRHAVEGNVWRQAPPGAVTGDEVEPRAGTTFRTLW